MDSLKEKIALAINEVQEEFATAVGTAVINALSGGDITIGDIAELMGEGGDETSSPRTKKTSSSKPRKSGGGKRHRRTPEELQEGLDNLVRCVKAQGKEGATAEVIREELGVERKELPLLIKEALSQKILSKSGKKRGTVYHVGKKASSGGGGGSKKKAKAASKSKSKSKKHAPKTKAKTSSKKASSSSKKSKGALVVTGSSNGTTAAAAASAE